MMITHKSQKPINSIASGSSDLAFAVMVLASYFAMFSELKETDYLRLIAMVLLGVGYISFGIYGYSFCLKQKSFEWTIFYFLIQIPLGSLIVFLGKGAGFSALLLLPLAGHAVVMAPGYWLYFVNGMIVFGYAVVQRLNTGNWSEIWTTLPTVFAGLIYIMVFTQMALDEEKSRREVERLVGELEDANQRLRIYADEIEHLAIIQERNRLAREIHDGLGHYLTTIHMQLQAAQAVLEREPKKAGESIEKARSQSQLALIDVRKSVAALRVDEVQNEDFELVVQRAIRPCQWIDIKTNYEVLGENRPLTTVLRDAIFRILQETVNNACKYSKAKNFYLTIDYTDQEKIKVMIADDGIGANEFHGGYGLRGVKERVEMLNGNFLIKTSKNSGFKIGIELPYDKND